MKAYRFPAAGPAIRRPALSIEVAHRSTADAPEGAGDGGAAPTGRDGDGMAEDAVADDEGAAAPGEVGVALPLWLMQAVRRSRAAREPLIDTTFLTRIPFRPTSSSAKPDRVCEHCSALGRPAHLAARAVIGSMQVKSAGHLHRIFATPWE
jgi:hypothetical protein